MNTTPTRIASRNTVANPRKTPGFWSIAQQGPIRRLVFWFALTLAIAIALQLITLALGASPWLLSPRTGRSVIGVIMLVSAILIMAHSGKDADEYGLAISDKWAVHFPIGLAAGALLIALITALTLGLGAYDLRPLHNTDWLNLLGKAVGGVTFAFITSLAATGFIFGSLKSKLPHQWAVVISALLFAILFQSIAGGAGADHTLAAMAMRFFVMLVAAQLRLVTGDLVLSMGFLVGLFSTERLVRKAGLLGDVKDVDAASLLAPNHLMLMSPAMWAALAVAAVLLAWRLHVSPPPQLLRSHRVSSSFCRVYPFATMGALAPIDVWLIQLCKARFRVDLIYVPRLIATLASSLVNTIITLPERLIVPILLRNRTVPPPVFIVGVHRTGTTLLQNLMSLDPALVTPTSWQVMNPYGFLFTGWLLRPLYTLLTPWKRPMDSVRFGLSTPNEEEFALANMSGLSPDWSLRLPKLCASYDRFAYPDQMTATERARWRRLHKGFLQRLTLFTRKRPLLKSPHNTGRVSELVSMYPGAKFIHLRRRPADVLRSNIHIAQTAHVLFQLQDPAPGKNYSSRFLSNYRQMEKRFYDAADLLDENSVIDIRYEDLVADPLTTIREIYNQLEMDRSPKFKARLQAKINELSSYQPNSHPPLGANETHQLEDELSDLIARWRQADSCLDANVEITLDARSSPFRTVSDPSPESVQ